MRKLIACLACRNNGTRLYGKPLQNLDIEKKITILDYMIESIKSYSSISDIVLAISEGDENISFIEVAKKHNIKYIIGNEDDVLLRLIKACEYANGTDIFRVTTESPFTYFEKIKEAWNEHLENDYDLTTLDNLPDGSGFEICKLSTYLKSWKNGNSRHRSELCSLYIRENKSDFKINYVEIPSEIKRLDIRLTVDYPEDLVFCRKIYNKFKGHSPRIPLIEIINYIDKNPKMKELVDPFVDEGLKTMYL
tara:strand:- start:5515 stop:6264 length:750 start_codon:yes stop_codon:yes gene_type:complete